MREGPTLQGLLIGFAVLGVLFALLQAIWPSVRGQRIFRKGFLTDCVYWIFTPLVTRTITPIAVVIAIVPLAAVYGVPWDRFRSGFGPMAELPAGTQAALVFVCGDFLGYWQHRFFHGRQLWPFHAVHHSSEELDWLSSVRLHPINDVGSRIFQAVPILAMGFDPRVVAIYAPAATFYAILLHANLSWDYGPFRYLIASPRFHRWHHTKAAEGQDKNFAGFFPFWDLLFGTFFMPKGRQPTVFGVDDPVPGGLLGQLVYPFRRR